MRRREFIKLIGNSTLVWPLAARAQTAAPVVGFINSGSSQPQALAVAAYRRGLEETGFIDGKNVLIESRWVDGEYDRLPGLIADSIKRNVAVIMAGGPPAAQAARKATSTIPVVFTTGDDPVQAGLVDSINRPAGNLTGVHIFFSELEAKKLGLLLEIVPQATMIAALVNPGYRRADGQAKELTAAAQKFGQQIQIVRAGSEGEIRTAFATMKESKIGGLIVAADPFFNAKRDQIVSLAAQYAIPGVYE